MTNLILKDLNDDVALDAEAAGTIHGGAFLGQDQLGHLVEGNFSVQDSGFSLFSPKIFFAPTIAVGPQIQVGISQDFTNIVSSQLIGRLDGLLPA